jgi:hypothetical protein
VAAVTFLLSIAVFFYIEAPDLSTVNPSLGRPAGSPAGPDPTRVGTESATPTAASSSSGLGWEDAIQLEASAVSAKPFQAVRIQGRYHGAADTFLWVERSEGAKWVAFPVPTKTDHSGQFTAYVELGRPGRYWLRVIDPDSGVTSKPFVLVIKR